MQQYLVKSLSVKCIFSVTCRNISQNMLSHALLFVLVCVCVCVSVMLSIVITSLGEERAAFRASVCLFCMRQVLSFFPSSWCLGLVAACDCDTP